MVTARRGNHLYLDRHAVQFPHRKRIASHPHPLPSILRAGEGCRRRGEGLLARQETIGYHIVTGMRSRPSCSKPDGGSNSQLMGSRKREQRGAPKSPQVPSRLFEAWSPATSVTTDVLPRLNGTTHAKLATIIANHEHCSRACMLQLCIG